MYSSLFVVKNMKKILQDSDSSFNCHKQGKYITSCYCEVKLLISGPSLKII